MDIIVIAGLALPAAAFYTVPALLAHARRLAATRRIIAVNLFLGWTILGWVTALSMAARRQTPPGQSPAPGGSATRSGHASAVSAAGQGPAADTAPQSPSSGPSSGRHESHIISVWHSLN